MSNPYKKLMSLAGVNFENLSIEELRKLAREIVANKIHGISFSPYVEGQTPKTDITIEQIDSRLAIIENNVNWIRSFSCTKGNENIPRAAKRKGLKTMVGAWLDDDLDNNEKEIESAIAIAQQGNADILAIGNEVLLREELSQELLISYLKRVKKAVPNVTIGYVDAYYIFEQYPEVANACDVILANCYPFWEGCPAEYALLYMKDMYQRAKKAANGKKVIISETGWPNIGTAEYGAIPNERNALSYFIDSYRWTQQDNIDLFYFSSFDETWKVADEGDVGAYWGLWDQHGKFKY